MAAASNTWNHSSSDLPVFAGRLSIIVCVWAGIWDVGEALWLMNTPYEGRPMPVLNILDLPRDPHPVAAGPGSCVRGLIVRMYY